jgi:protein-S-isoprenylcysteine O-methyltransferase Ste14
MSKPIFPKPYAGLVQRLRVPSGFLLGASFLWFARPTPQSLLLGLPVSAAGLWLRGWAAGHLRKNQKLTTSGPYGWLRNPLYAGTLLAASGLAIAAAQPWLGALVAAVFLLVYWPVMEQEEQHLRKLFPEFEAYAARVPLLAPRPPAERAPERFDWAIYRRNEEYKALLGFALAAAYLAYRSFTAIP